MKKILLIVTFLVVINSIDNNNQKKEAEKKEQIKQSNQINQTDKNQPEKFLDEDEMFMDPFNFFRNREDEDDLFEDNQEQDKTKEEQVDNKNKDKNENDKKEKKSKKIRKQRKQLERRQNILSDGFFNNDGFGTEFGFNMMKHFDNMRKQMKNMREQKNNDPNSHSYSHSEQYFETIDNNNGDAKRVEVGQIMDQNDNNKPEIKVINKADDMHGRQLNPEEEKEQIQKHKRFYSHFKPFKPSN